MGLEYESKVENEDGEGITIEDLASFMKISTRTAERHVEQGKYQKLSKRGPHGETLLKPPPNYDPGVAAAARAAGEQVTLQTLVTTLGAMVNDGRRHQERLLDLVAGPIEKMVDRMAKREEALFTRIETQQDKIIEQSAVVERLLSEEHNRFLATVESEARGRRLDQGLELIKGALPTVLEAVSLKGVNVRKLQAADKVISALPPEVIETILSAQGEDSLLPAEVRADALVLLEEIRKDAASKQSKAPVEGVADLSTGAAKAE